MNEIKYVLFDLFHTLIKPKLMTARNEPDVLGITVEEWLRFSDDRELCFKRATNNLLTPQEIIEDIAGKLNIIIGDAEKAELLEIRDKRLKNALVNVEPAILKLLSDIRASDRKICLVSNVDRIDLIHWEESPLKDLFDYVVFSCEVGYAKPHADIYEIAMKSLGALPEECVFVGDGGSDELEGAKKLGIRTVMTSHFLKRPEEKHKYILGFADFHIEDIEDLRELLNIPKDIPKDIPKRMDS